MDEITITQNGFDGLYMSYLFGRVKERFSFLPAEFAMQKEGEQTEIALKTERAYCPYIRRFTEENLADVIAVGYKYAYFDKRLTLPLLSQTQRRLLITALVAADLPEDRAYALRRFRGSDTYSLDGVYHFRLRELTKRWQDIVDYVPVDMGEASLNGFLEFLTEDGNGKLFVKGGKVYDEEYRRLTKSALTGKETPIGEIVLGQAERVYCFGETDRETALFLKKYYGEKAVFC
ncbi:MAG: hypothetical protein IJ514_07525 [Clostridia bacterium]|nr:hypothetical protein [Clostridia bacterium]